MNSWQWYGSPAHFIGGYSCRFHLATKVGEYVISTVGDYDPSNSRRFEDIGINRMFETMVFKFDGICECGCGLPDIVPSEIDMEGYMTRSEANAGHIAMCKKYAEES